MMPRWPVVLFIAAIGCRCTETTAPAGAGMPSAPAKAAAQGSAAPKAGPSAVPSVPKAPPAPSAIDLELPPGGEGAVRAPTGAVTSVEPNATRAGISVLENGGNAVDAAIAVAYALAVTHPSAGNIGGGGFMLVRPPEGPTAAIDFREAAPRALTQAKFDTMIEAGAKGAQASGVPGSVAGLNLAHRRFGSVPLAEVLAPAIKLAQEGHRIGERQAKTIAWSWRDLRRDKGGRSIFGDARGRPLRQGARLVRPRLAETLKRIAEHGDPGFYEGPTAASIARMPGSLISEADLKDYRARFLEPLALEYRGLQVHTMPPPSAGGVAVVATLALLERWRAHAAEPGSAAELHLLIEAARRAHAERRFNVADPSRWSQAELAQRIARWQSGDMGYPELDAKRATPSAEVHPLFPAAMKELEHTTHFSVVDANGMVVSCTTTLSAGFGAKVVVPETDIVLNNSVAAFGTVGESTPLPGVRTTSSMAPTLVINGSNVVLVLGSPGGDTIPNTVVQVLRNVIDHKQPLAPAIRAPRIHHGLAPDQVFYERRRPLPLKVRQALTQMGHELVPRYDIGDANNILIQEQAAWAYADPREGGLALAAKPGGQE